MKINLGFTNETNVSNSLTLPNPKRVFQTLTKNLEPIFDDKIGMIFWKFG